MSDDRPALRVQFSAQLDEIRSQVEHQFGLVLEGITGATFVLLDNDVEAAERLVTRDQVVDDLEQRIEASVEQQLLLEAPVARDFRFLMTVARIVPELERTADLAEHIAAETVHGFGRDLTPELRGVLQDMGDLAGHMWRAAADAFAAIDGDVGEELDRTDDEMDQLHRRFVELVAAQLEPEGAMRGGLVGRYYERIGDHAVNVARRIAYIANGQRTS